MPPADAVKKAAKVPRTNAKRTKLDPDTERIMRDVRQREFKDALWLLKDFKDFNSNRFSQKVQVQLSDDEFSIVEDALEGYVWWAGERLGYSTDKVGALIHGLRTWKRVRRKH